MKTILMSIRPRHVKNILNGEKTIEIRKKFPKDYVGWVYIYCTKQDSLGCIKDIPHDRYFVDCVDTPQDFEKMDSGYDGKGKVVARFWCDKVEPAYKFYVEELCQLACVTKDELYEYAGGWYNVDDLLAINITKLEIFDKPKEASEFLRPQPVWKTSNQHFYQSYQLTRAPQSWCYVITELKR